MDPIKLATLHLLAARHHVRSDTSHHAAVIRQCVAAALAPCSDALPDDDAAATALAHLTLEESTRPGSDDGEPQ